MNFRRCMRWCAALLWLAAPGFAQALTCTNIATGNWNTVANWSCGRVPQNIDDVVIINNTTVTVNIAGAVAGSVTINTGANATNLAMGGVGTTLTVTNAGGLSGNVVINGPSAAVTKQISVGARSLTVTGTVTINGGTTTASATNIAQLNITTGSATIGGLVVAGSGINSIATATVTGTGTLTVNGNASVASGTLGRAEMTLSAGGTINVNGNLAVSTAASTNNTGDATVTVSNAAGLLNVTGDVTVTGGGAVDRDALLRVTVASNVGRGITVGGALNINATVAGSSSVTLVANSRMTVTGAVTNNDLLTIGAGLFTAQSTLSTGSAGSAIAATTAVTTGTLSVTGNTTVTSGTNGLKTMSLTTGTITIGGSLDVTAAAATADTGDATVSVTGTGTLNVNTTATVTGGTNANRDALLQVTGASALGQGINITGDLTINATVAGSSTVRPSSGANVGRITVGGVLTNNNTVNVNAGLLTVTGNYTQVNRAFLVQTTVSTGTLTVGGLLTNNATETITISTTGIVNANGGFTNSGTFTNTAAGQLFLRGAANTINGTFTRGTGTVTMNGSAAQALSGTALEPVTTAGDGLYNFVISNAAGVTLGSNVVARNVITLTSGEVSTGANVLVSELSCATPSVSRTSGHIVGNFQKLIPAGASTCNYEVGTAGAYTPASLAFTGVTAGRLIVRSTASDHPNVNTSGFTINRTVNRYWTLTTTGVTGVALTTFTNYAATLTFINPGDMDAGIDTALFEIKRWSGAAWFNTTVGTRTATTTQASGITALGELQIGEVAATPPGSFNAFETSTGAGLITGVIRTKRAGIAFSLDVVAINAGAQLNTFTDTVRVDLLGNNTLGVALDGNNCPTSSTVVQTVSPDPTITSGRSTVSFAAVADSWRDVRVRVRWPAAGPVTVTSCSTDNFAIRPDAFTAFAASNATRTTAGLVTTLNSTAFGATLHNAGRPFSVRANAVNGAGSPAITTNYTGTPVATTAVCGPGVGFEACTASVGTLSLGTTFVAGQLTSDVAQYNDVGAFSVQLTDSDFASVDAADGSTLSERQIVSAVINVGRFTPDNFAVAYNVPVFAPACTGFTYQGQAFNYSTAPVMTVTAREAGGATTTRYTGSWWRLSNSSLTPAAQASRYAAASGTLDTTGLPAVGADPAIVDSGNGTGTLTFSSGSGLAFARSTTTPSAPFFADIALALNVIDTDGVTFAGNPAAFGAATAGSGIQFGAAMSNDNRVRYGRLRLSGATGSQLLSLRIPVEAQYWNGSAFITNTLDSCTTLMSGDVGLGNFLGSLNSGETTATIVNSPLQSGRSAIQLSAPGAANHGSVDVTLNLGATGATNADACAGLAPAATAANRVYLRGRWCNPPGTYTKDPSARARFGSSRSSDPAIYRREQ